PGGAAVAQPSRSQLCCGERDWNYRAGDGDDGESFDRPPRCLRTPEGAFPTATGRQSVGVQHETQWWLFFAPKPSRSLIVSGYGCGRCTGPLAMSTVVCPERLTAFTSAPRDTR